MPRRDIAMARRKVGLVGRLPGQKRLLLLEPTIWCAPGAKARDFEASAIRQAKAVFGPEYEWEAVAL